MYYVHSWCMGLFKPSHIHEVGGWQWGMGMSIGMRNEAWGMGNGKWAMGNGQWAMGNGQWGT